MFRTIDEAFAAYRTVRAGVGEFYQLKSEMLKNPSHWNSADQREFRDKLMKLEGAEDALGLTVEEANEGRRALGLPEKGKVLAVV